MGNKILVSVFDTEQAAFEGLSALKDLHRDGDLTVYATSVLVKDLTGTVAVRQTAEKGPLGTLLGTITGALVGLLGGAAGAAVGAYIGGFGGLTFDLFRAGVGIDFVEEVGGLLTPGKAAIIADVDETWTTPVNTRMREMGGTTFRRLPGEVIDAQLIRESEAADQELAELQAELKESRDESKAKVKKSIAGQKAKMKATQDRIKKTMDEADVEFKARMATLHEQQGKSRDRQKARIDARIEELKAAHEARKAKLEAAHTASKKSADDADDALES